MNEAAPSHPEAQTMAAFVEGRLAPDEIASVAGHLRECTDCRTVVAETARFTREEETPRATARISRPWLLAVAAVLAAITITVPLLRWNASRHAPTSDSSPIARLIAIAPHDHRVVRARLSGFPWARLQAPSRGDAKPDPADLKVAGVVGEVLEVSGHDRQPESSHATGVAYLLIGRKNDSVAALEQAARNSTDAHTWNDLAAARFAVAVEDEHPSQLPEALADADRALRLDPKNAEALFNRALIVEHLGVREQARNAWKKYLDIDGASAWSVEARAHLRALEKTSLRFDRKMIETMPADVLVRQFPEEVRIWGEGPLLAEWADAEAGHDAALASTRLTQVRALASALARFNGEHFLDDAVTAVERASGTGRPALVAGQRLYRDARIDYNHRQLGAAERQFRRATQLFALGNSPMAAMATYYAESTSFDQNRGDQARGRLIRLIAQIDRSRHRALTAQIHWELAVYANGAGDWGAAANESAAAYTIFQALGERDDAAIISSIASVALELIGEPDLAWRRRRECFTQLSAGSETQKLGAALRNAASTLSAIDQSAAAAAIMRLLIEERQDSAQISLNRADEARFAARNGEFERARQSLANARTAAAQVTDAALRERVNRQIDLADATLHADDPRSAITSLSRSISFFAERNASVDLAEAYLHRARNERAVGDIGAALEDTLRAFSEVEKQGSTIRNAGSRLRFLDVAAQIIEETIDLRLSNGDTEGAFIAANRARANPAAPAATISSNAISRRLSPSTAVVQYVVLPKTVVVFCVLRSGLVAQRIEIDRHDLKRHVNTFADLIRRRSAVPEINTRGAALYRLLIEPLQDRLAGVNEIVFVPDGQLYALPFAALWNDAQRKYLAEGFTIRFAESATSRPEAVQSLQPALIIADPLNPNAPRLPASREEAASVAALYGGTLLTGNTATRTAFSEAASWSALIHFAGHAISDAEGSYAALSLTPDGSDSGLIEANEIPSMRLLRHPLVILAACGTFRGSMRHVAGMSSLAHAFLLAGARGVIGTMWEIDDDVSAPLFLRLHNYLHAGATPSRALRQAQLDLLRSADPRLVHPATWAPAESISNN